MDSLQASDDPVPSLRPVEPYTTADPLIKALGMVRWAASDDEVAMEITPGATACNAGGDLHGGALSAWLDMAMYELAKRRLGACVTISLDTGFLAAGCPLPLVVTARFLRSGRSIAFLTAGITQAGQNIAAATAIYKRSGPRQANSVAGTT